MLRPRRFLVFATAILLVSRAHGIAVAQGTDHFTVNIPRKVSSPYLPITRVLAFVGVSKALATSGALTFTFKDENAAMGSITCSTTGCGALSIPLPSTEAGASGSDLITMQKVSGPNEEPLRYEVYFDLRSNFRINSGNGCVNTQSASVDTYTVSISSNNSMQGVCLESFDGLQRPGKNNLCTGVLLDTNEVPVPLDDPSDLVAVVSKDPLAIVDAPTQPKFACYDPNQPEPVVRPPLDVVLVLDKSGSMSIQDSGQTSTRIAALQTAADSFLDAWKNLSPVSDNAGLVTFSTTSSLITALEDLSTNETTIRDSVSATCPGGSICPDGSTSIGGGLNQASSLVPPASGRRKVVLLMTDGQQNTDPMVEVTSGASPSIGLYCANPAGPLCTIPAGHTLANPFPLSNLPQMYTVTLGPSANVDPGIQQAIGNLTHGFYLNSEDNPNLLSPFFIELLQNFVRFNSYETVRLVSSSVKPAQPYATTIPITTTSHNAVFSLMWSNQFGALRMTLTPPGGGTPIVREDASGFLQVNENLPLTAPYDPTGSWAVKIEAVPEIGIRAAAVSAPTGIPFNFHLMTEDPAFRTELEVVPADYVTGGNIHLRAGLRRFGGAVPGFGSHPGDKVVFDLVKPGVSVGDLLSDSTASTTPPPGNADIQAGVDAKLFYTLQATPSALRHDQLLAIPMFDDGKPEHGDDVAGDGIYNALYPGALPGHYNFLFGVESTDPSAVRFSRQQLRTAYVRSIPDGTNTAFNVTFSGSATRNKQVQIIMVPRFKPSPGCPLTDPHCGRMGPGWANYFWFTAPGHPPFKAIDNLDGSYTATMSFTGTVPPISVHFENVLAIIGDSVSAGELPDPLGPGNVVKANLTPSTYRFALFADGGGAVPNGAFGNTYKQGAAFDAGLEFLITSRLSAEGVFGYDHFDGKSSPGLNTYRFSGNLRLYLTSAGIQPYLFGGGGAYVFTSSGFSSAYGGGNAGAGVLFKLSPRFGIQGAYDFHAVDTSGSATLFSEYLAGFRIAF